MRLASMLAVLAWLSGFTAWLLVTQVWTRSRTVAGGCFIALPVATVAVGGFWYATPGSSVVALLPMWITAVVGYSAPWLLLSLPAVALRRTGAALLPNVLLVLAVVVGCLWLGVAAHILVRELAGRCLPPGAEVGGECDLTPG